VLQQGEIQRVGGMETIKVDVRIIAATNKDLEEMVKAKTFREDLYYRLNVVRIRMPALRERADDIPQIVDFCLQNLVKQKKARVSKVSPETLSILVRHRWPGNVRELENVIYRSAVIAQGDTILPKDLPQEIRDAVGALPTVAAATPGPATEIPMAVPATSAPFDAMRTAVSEGAALAHAKSVASAIAAATASQPELTIDRALDFLHAELGKSEEPILERIEREMIKRVVVAQGGNILKASEQLGITRATLRKRIDELGIRV
jgi:two-component system nitrogen regulation response regulator GlnG